MPIPLLPLIPLIAAGASQIGNAVSQGSMNRQSRKWNEKMYGRQRQDSLADWNMQNEYNSPANQMQRFRSAGLNPALMYGNGANQPTAQIRSSQVESWNPQAPQVNLGNNIADTLQAFTDIKLKEAQTDNMAEQKAVIQEEARLKQAQTIATLMQSGLSQVQAEKIMMEIDTGRFDLKQKETLADTNIDMRKQELRKLQAETTFTINEDERKTAQNAASIQEAMERILTLRAERELNPYKKAKLFEEVKEVQRNNTIKDLDIKLKKNGIQPHDPLWQRFLTTELDKIHNRLIPAKEALKNMFKSKTPSSGSTKGYKFTPHN